MRNIDDRIPIKTMDIIDNPIKFYRDYCVKVYNQC